MDTATIDIDQEQKLVIDEHHPSSEVLLSGTPLCTHLVKVKSVSGLDLCSNRSMPGSNPPKCHPHGGIVQLRQDGTLGVIGPGATRTIARMANLDEAWLRQVLRGKGNSSVNLLEKISKVVGLKVSELLEYIESNKE